VAGGWRTGARRSWTVRHRRL